MNDNCVGEIEKVLGRQLGTGEARTIEQQIAQAGRNLARRDPAGWAGMSRSDKLMASAKAAQEEALARAGKKAQRQASNLVAQVREVQALTIDRAAMRGEHKAHTWIFQRLRQLENTINGIRHEATGQVLDAVLAVEPKFLKLVENDSAVRLFARAVYGEKLPDHPAIMRAAKAYRDGVEALRVRANAAGADIGALDYGYLPQPHDVGRIARAGRDAWVDFIAPLLDRARYLTDEGVPMTDAEFRAVIESAYDTLSTEGRNKLVPGAAGKPSRAARFDDAHRVLHFRDAGAHLDYLSRFGRGGMLEAITGHVGMMAKNIGLMEEFGANPNATFRLLKDTAEKLDNAAGKREAFATLDMVWDELTGVNAAPVDANLAANFQAVRNYVTAAKLQGVMLSSITDASTMNAAARYNGLSEVHLWRNTLASFGGDTTAEATRLGLATEAITGEMAQWHTDTLAQGWTAKLANTTLRLTGVEKWTHALRRGFGITLAARLGDMRATGWGELHANDRARLSAAGVSERDWRLWQAAELTEFRGQQILAARALREIPAARLAELGASARDVNRATSKLLGFIDQEAHYAVTSPDLMTRAAIRQGTRAGTWGGEILRSTMLFKSFPMAMVIRHVRRLQSLSGGTQKAVYSARLLASLTFMGAMALQLKEIAAGKDPRDMTESKFWGAAFVQGGGIGIFGDILYTGMKGNARGGQANWTSLLGPVAGTGFDALDIANDLRREAFGEDTKAGAKVVRFLKGNAPLINLWYLRAAIDHLVFHELQETISPGYLASMRERTYRDYGQDYWYEPGDKLPDRAPNLEAAGGQ